ncbi:O(6)-methylguanine-induced apoptosis 2, partial [Phlyctochytrium bullatum]
MDRSTAIGAGSSSNITSSGGGGGGGGYAPMAEMGNAVSHGLHEDGSHGMAEGKARPSMRRRSSITNLKPKEPAKKTESSKGKQKHLKLFMHPPSIPTRFQTFHFDDHEPKGFNSTAPRFDQRMDELPGPGYYKKEKLAFNLLDETSVSRKGYGVGFASKTKRFQKPPTDADFSLTKVSPADYDTRKRPQYSYSVAHSLTSSFRSRIARDPAAFATAAALAAAPTAGPALFENGALPPSSAPVADATVDVLANLAPGIKAAAAAAAAAASNGIMGRPSSSYRRMFGRNEAPGPGTYDPSAPAGKSRVQENGASFVFKSRTRRSDINSSESTPGRYAPPPGAYNIIEKANPKAGANAAFKATARPDILARADLDLPGPGAYELRHHAGRELQRG